MGPVNLDKLIAAISSNDVVEWTLGGLLAVSSSPIPYVPPKFRIISTSARGTSAADKLAVEVIFVQAPAAVGKSITANHISSSISVPVLDLATAGIGGASLDGLIGRGALYSGSRDRTRAIDDFHNGDLPVIVDALDEGQMVSGQVAFEAFLESTAELILENREVKDKPKIVFFGRPEATELSDTAVQIAGEENIATCVVELEFFSKTEATELIKEYAKSAMLVNENEAGCALLKRQSPYDDLIDWYFRRIETALQIPDEKLWEDPTGKPFAGYAPVLSAIGRLLAEIRQPHTAIQDLRQDGQETAWAVIERVMQYILEREQQKVTEPLKRQFAGALDECALSQAYSPREQLAYLAQVLQKQKIVPTGDVKFSDPRHNQAYIDNVRNFCNDHAFIRKGHATNDVFESFIITTALRSNCWTTESPGGRLEYLSRYPFLWRCFWRHEQTHSDGSSPVDGRYVGFLLRSYCSDPLTDTESRIQIREGARGLIIAGTKLGPIEDDIIEFQFSVNSPLQLFGSIRNFDFDVSSVGITIVGDSKRGDSRSFRFVGDNSISCEFAEVETEWIVINGSLMIETETGGAPNPNLRLSVEKGRLGCSGEIGRVPPWNDWAIGRDTRLDIEIPPAAASAFTLIRTFEAKFGAKPFIYTNNLHQVSMDDGRLRWLRKFSDYPQFLAVSIGTGVAAKESVDRSGTFNQRIRFLVSLDELGDAGVRLLVAKTGRPGSTSTISVQMREFWRRYGLGA